MKVGVVLSSGGLRGAAHLGVLKKLRENHIPFDVMVGVSAGAIISAFYAGVGLSIEDMIHEAKTFQGKHLLLHGLGLRLPDRWREKIAPHCGVIPERLRQLEEARFDRLNFSVSGLGIVCHDILTRKPIYFSSGDRYNVPLAPVVRASASIPFIIPSRRVEKGEHRFRLTDGGVSDSLPVKFAQSEPLGATHLIVSDCRDRIDGEIPKGANVVYLQHKLKTVGSLRSPRESLLAAVHEGEEAVTPETLARIRAWS